MSGRAGRDGVDGRLTGTRDGEPTGWNLWDARNSGHVELYLESLRHMKAIPSYSLLKQRTVSSRTQTPHGTDTAACHGRRPRRPSGQGTHPGTVARVLRSGCYTTGSLTLN